MARVPRSFRSITFPIVLGVVAELLSIALLVGWILVIVRNVELSQQVSSNTWLMVSGIVSFVVIMTVLVLFSVFLVREILEARRHYRFIDSVTHELKSPLASLRLCVETLERRELAADQRSDLHQMMLDDLDRLTAFIDDILESSKVGYGPGGDVAFAEVRLFDISTRCAERVRARHKVPEAAVAIEVPEEIVVWTDRTALEVVLRNLLDNAVKYSEDDIRVRLVAGQDGSRVRIQVLDRGIGIPLAHQKRVFDRFYRAPMESVHARHGTGLGLYVASQLVRQLGGRLKADSAGAGKGTTMSFELPLHAPGSGRRAAAAR